MSDRFLSALGLAKKAGAAVFGTEPVRDALRSGKAKLVIICSDVSAATRKRLTDSSTYYNTEYISVPYDMNALSQACGFKKNISAAAVCDANFVKLIKGCTENFGTKI